MRITEPADMLHHKLLCLWCVGQYRQESAGQVAQKNSIDLPWHSWAAGRSTGCGILLCSGCWRTHLSQRTSWTGWQWCRWQLPSWFVLRPGEQTENRKPRQTPFRQATSPIVLKTSGCGRSPFCVETLGYVSEPCPSTLTTTSLNIYASSPIADAHISGKNTQTCPLLPHQAGWPYLCLISTQICTQTQLHTHTWTRKTDSVLWRANLYWW